MSTRRQEFGPFRFETPEEWSRRELLVFAPAPQDSAAGSTLVVTRDARPLDEELQAFAWRRLFEIARRAPDCQVLEPHLTTVGGQAAFRVTLGREDESGAREEELAWIDGGQGNVLVVTCTSRQREGRESFERVLATLVLDAQTAAPAPTPSRPNVAARITTPLPPPPVRETFDPYGSLPIPGLRAAR
jgi:hypothetical protein